MSRYSDDQPIKDPKDDLLDSAAYAEGLARYVDGLHWPFTLGVYGEWGEGKTSFVHLVRHYLSELRPGEQLEFIEFSAWPYSSSEAVWRALARALASRLCQVEPSDLRYEKKRIAERRGLLPSLKRLLSREVVVLWEDAEDKAKQDFRRVVTALDRSGAVSLNRSPQAKRSALTSLLGEAANIGSLATAMPWLSFFGKFARLKVADVSGGSMGYPRDQVDSVDQAREILRQVFKRYRGSRRIMLFIDDLDRCLPEVSVEILEALRIFFSEISCLAVVAVDEQIIGRGLSARYRSGGVVDEVGLDARQGREYFEKIIHLGVRVPARTAEKSDRLIAMHAPAWACASDVLQLMAGTNPRRIKQACNAMNFRMAVRLEKSGRRRYGVDSLSPEQVRVFLAIIQLKFVAPEFLDILRQEVEKGVDLLGWLQSQISLESFAGDERVLSAGALGVSLEDVVSPLVSEAVGQEALLTLIGLSTVGPSRVECSWVGSDRAFMRALREIQDLGGFLPARSELCRDVEKLLRLYVGWPRLVEPFCLLARGPSFGDHLSILESFVLDEAEPSESLLDEVEGFSGAWAFLRDLFSDKADESSDEILRLFGDEPRFSTMLPGTLLATREAWESISSKKRSNWEAAWTLEEGSRWQGMAESLVKFFPQKVYQALIGGLELRQRAAVFFEEHRRLAKIEALLRNWPGLARDFFLGSKLLEEFETVVAKDASGPLSLPKELSMYSSDGDLLSLLKSPTSFSGVQRQDLRDFLRAREAFAPDVLTAKEGFKDEEVGSSKPQSEVELFSIVRLLLERGSGSRREISVSVNALGKSVVCQVAEERVARLKWLVKNYPSVVAKRSSSRVSIGGIGREMFSLLFEGLEAQACRELFLLGLSGEDNVSEEGSPRVRLLVSDNSGLGNLPWEALYIPEPFEQFASLSRGCSLVRHVQDSRPAPSLVAGHTLRVLFVLAIPRDSGHLGLEREVRSFANELDWHSGSSHVEFEVLSSATPERLHRRLLKSKPHILHFFGHSTISMGGHGAIFLEDNDGSGVRVSSDSLRALVDGIGVRLAVLSGSSTGQIGPSGLEATSVGALLAGGVSTVIGTIGPLSERQAVIFNRAFYRALIPGFSVDRAVVEARIQLSVAGEDWSTYALFQRLRVGVAVYSDGNPLTVEPPAGSGREGL